MLLDLTTLTARQLVLFLISFVITFAVIGRWRLFPVAPQPGRSEQRLQGRKSLYFAGLVPAVVITGLSFFVLPDMGLILGLALTTLLIIGLGRIDEKNPLTARAQLFWQIAIAVILALCGWSIPYVSHPFGQGILLLGALSFPLTIIWVVFMINALNWFDGADGLAGSVALIACLTLVAISLLPATQDTTTLQLSLIGAGSLLGFLLFNLPPARVYLGTVGSWFLGSYLAVIAIVGGGKVATTALVLAIPLLDVLFVVVQRLLAGQRPWVGDTRHHLFHRLAAAGFSPFQIILIISLATAALGVAAVTLQTIAKLWILAALPVALTALVIFLAYAGRQATSTRR